MDISMERAALLGLLTRGTQMEWAKYRTAFADGNLPSDIATPEDVDRGDNVILDWIHGAEGASFYTCLDDGYPSQLLEVWDYPPFVFVKGDETPLHGPSGEVGVSVVGSRRASRAAQSSTRRIARGLVDQGITVISGLAEGIDQAAHRTALEHGARTVGVIGTGIDRYYPRSSRTYQEAMEAGRGMVLSQFPPGASPTQASFPMRNGVMSAYGRATIIVEASEKSGTRHQAKHAVKHGRPVILAEPVTRHTSWGAELADDPSIDAHMARDPEHAVYLALEILDRTSPATPDSLVAF